MAFTDIRSMELADGTSLPIGHGEFAVSRGTVQTANSSRTFRFRVNCLNTGSGLLQIIISSQNGPWTTVTIPWLNCRPVGNYKCESMTSLMVPSKVSSLYSVVGGEAGSYITVTFSSTNSAMLDSAVGILTLPDCSITGDAATMTGATTLTRVNTLSLLTENVDYGTTEPTAGHKGRIFFKKV